MALHGSRDAEQQLDLPFPLSLVAGRYLVFDIDVAIHLRREHSICGYNVGTLHTIPSQNNFLGLPMIIMPEEAQMLVDDGIAYIVDDSQAHNKALYQGKPDQTAAYLEAVDGHADLVRNVRSREREEGKRRALELRRQKAIQKGHVPPSDSTASTASTSTSYAHFITPTTSSLLFKGSAESLLDLSPSNEGGLLSNVPPTTYPLFRHLHRRGYFMTPGLRFGCQFTTYPGDPLRFHSHFLTTDFGWNQEINLMDIVGGGRLGTGVKKGFLIGGKNDAVVDKELDIALKTSTEPSESTVRTYSIEWAVM
jgi:tRNA-splicing endonuclease subunit Sen34